jgi:hypothetical protein
MYFPFGDSLRENKGKRDKERLDVIIVMMMTHLSLLI